MRTTIPFLLLPLFFLFEACSNTQADNHSEDAAVTTHTMDHPNWYSETTTYLDKQTVNSSGDPIVYPEGNATVSSKLVVWKPGFETGIHKHPVPIAVSVFQGELTVDFTESGTQLITSAGGSYVSTPDLWHKSSNKGTEDLIFSLVYMGTDQTEHTVAKE